MWEKAEETFLIHFSKLEKFSWGSRFFFEPGKKMGKFNFIRILNANWMKNNWKAFVINQNNWFKNKGSQLKIKIPDYIELPDFMEKDLERRGKSIVHLKTELSDFSGILLNKELTINNCQTAQDFECWWKLLAISNEIEIDDFAYFGYKNAFEFGSNLLLFYVRDNLIATARLDKVKGGFNLGSVAVCKEFQRRGFMQDLYTLLALNFRGVLYGQTNESSVTLRFRKKKPSTKIITTEHRYRFVGDCGGLVNFH